MDTDSFIVHVKIEKIYKDIAEDVETRFCTSYFELGRPVPKGKKKVIGLMEDELVGLLMKKIVGLRAKTYTYLKENNDEDKKAKGTKTCVIKKPLNLKIKKTV